MYTTNNYSKTHHKGQVPLKYHADTRLTLEHYKYLVKERGLIDYDEWLVAGCESMTQEQAKEYGFTAPSGGIMLKGTGNGQWQFKPDKPTVTTKSDGTQRVNKYLSQYGDSRYDVMLPPHPTDDKYWTDLEALKEHCYKIDGKPCIGITEGFFTAMVLTAKGFPTISLMGVEMGLTSAKSDPQGKRHLVPTLERFAKAGFGFIFLFDADCVTNKNVINAQEKLVHQLKSFNVPIYNGTGLWAMDRGKGADDYIINHGYEQFDHEVLSKVEPISDWAKRLENQLEPKGINKGKPTPQNIAKEIAEEYQPTWRYSDEQQTWRFWNGKYWEKRKDSYVRTSIKSVLDSRNIEYGTPKFIKDTIDLIKDDLTAFRWESFDRTKYIAFNNGVLEIEAKKLLPHQPGYGFTSVLPYDYNLLKPIDEYPSVIEALKTECPAIHQFMSRAMKDDEIAIKKLLAIINAVITFKLSKLQMFIHFYGLPSAGKGAMTRLIQKCVGKGNYRGSNIKSLSKPDEIANIIDKQLVVLPDERADAKLDEILSLTGNDEMTYRQLFKEGASDVFRGSIIISSNTPLFPGNTIGIDRRTCMVSFNNPIPDNERDSKIEDLMDNEIAQLIGISLTLSDSEVTTLIRGIGEANIPLFKLRQWQLKLESDSVASFFNELIVVDADDSITGSSLYTTYKEYCKNNGLNPLANNKFPGRFEELLRVIGVSAEKGSRGGNKVAWYGIRLREDYEETLTYEEQLKEQVKQSEQSKQKTKASEPTVEEHTQPTQPSEQNSVDNINSEAEEIKVGDYVKYRNTGEIGVVKGKNKYGAFMVMNKRTGGCKPEEAEDLEKINGEGIDPPCPFD